MKITAHTKELSAHLKWVSAATSKRPQVPILAGLLLDATGDELAMSATDYAVSHTARMAVEIGEPGRVVVSAKNLAGLIATIRTKVVTITADNRSLTVEAGRSEYRVPLMAVEDYPTAPVVGKPAGTIDADALRQALAVTTHAAADDGAQPQLFGVILRAESGVLHVAATDRFRVGMTEIDMPGTDLLVRVPHGTLSSAAKGLAGSVELGTDGRQLTLSDATSTVTIRTYEEPEIDIRQLDREQSAVNVTIECEELLDALKRVSLTVGQNQSCTLDITADGIELSGGTEGEFSGVEHVAATSDGAIKVALNPTYLAELLAACEPGALHIGLEPRRQLIFDQGGPTRHMLMTRRLDS